MPCPDGPENVTSHPSIRRLFRPTLPSRSQFGHAVTLFALLLLSASGASAQAYRKWYLAEGATGRSIDFVEDILIANPSSQDARVRITFLTGDGSTPAPYELTVKATSRATVRVNALPGLANAEVSAIVESLDNVDLVVERTMAWPSTTRRGAHGSPGVTAPATRWFLAEGSTGFFNTFILVANPSPTATARVKVTFLKPGGGTVVYKPNPATPTVEEFTLAPNTRFNVWPNAEVPELAGGQAFSTVVESLNSVGVIAERAMYWNTLTAFEGGHNSAGVTQSALTWLFAEGTTRTAPSLAFNTFLLLANPNAAETRARVSFFTSPGTPPLQRDYVLAANSRENVWVNVIPELANTDFAMKVESLAPTGGGAAQPIVAERAVYWGPVAGPPVPNWVDGHNTPGATAEAKKWVFAEGIEDGFSDAPGLNFDTYFLIANSSATSLALRATFVREDGTGIVRTFTVPAQSRFTMAGFEFPELTNQRFAAFFESTNDVTFVAERAVYWGTGYFAGHASTGVPWTGTIATPPAVPAHTVTAVLPVRGPTTGGTPVTITGTNFKSGTTTVALAGVAATNVVVVNATTITAVTGSSPSTSDVVGDVVVVNNGVSRTLAGAFTYEVAKTPEISTLLPASGPNTGGTTVTITGRNFNPASFIASFGGVAAIVGTVTPTSATVTTPPRTIAAASTSLTVDVTVNTGGASATAANAFTYTTFTVLDTMLAFGDSITAGTTNCFVDQVTLQRTCEVGDGGYPIRLKQEMERRYPSQGASLSVQNSGQPGEFTAEGRTRLPGAVIPVHDVVIILEGVNDLNAEEIGIGTIAANLRAMVDAAQAENKWVILGTLTPVAPTAFNPTPERVSALNEEIVKIAQQEGVVLADFATALANNASYLSGDGLHPSAAGYRRMAEYLLELIRTRFEPVPPAK